MGEPCNYCSHLLLYTPPAYICRYSTIRAYSKMVTETNDLAGQREVIAESMKAEVMEPLKQVMRDLTMERKKVREGEGEGEGGQTMASSSRVEGEGRGRRVKVKGGRGGMGMREWEE